MEGVETGWTKMRAILIFHRGGSRTKSDADSFSQPRHTVYTQWPSKSAFEAHVFSDLEIK